MKIFHLWRTTLGADTNLGHLSHHLIPELERSLLNLDTKSKDLFNYTVLSTGNVNTVNKKL